MILTEVFCISSYNFGSPRDQMIGLGIGFALKHKCINFEINPEPCKKGNLILSILLGIFIIAIIYLGIYLIIDTDVFKMNTIHYITTFIIGIFVWLLIFKKLIGDILNSN